MEIIDFTLVTANVFCFALIFVIFLPFGMVCLAPLSELEHWRHKKELSRATLTQEPTA